MMQYAGWGRTFSVEHLARVDANRKAHIRFREQMLAFKGECAARGDFKGARFFGDEAAFELKRERAATWLLQYLRGERADEPPAELGAAVAAHVFYADNGVQVPA
jgi:hypothetical protein